MEAAARVGEVFAGKYRLERLLGVGGMGAVYEAVHVGVEKRFAIKLLKADAARAPDSAQRFTQEARAAARIGHPNLVEVFDMGEAEDGTLYMVMELLVGRSLVEVLRDGPLSVARAMEIATAMLSALDAAHRAGFVHRDIKPANIFLAERPAGGTSVKVLDFGIAKLVTDELRAVTQSGVVVGTPLYMSPEQVLADKEVDGRADVWAVGAALFEMLTGRPVHLAPTATAAAVKVVTETAPRVRSLRADVDPMVDDLVARALAIDRAKRFDTAADMLEAMQSCHVSLAPTLSADSGLAPSVKTVIESAVQAKKRRSFALRAGGSLVLGVVVGGTVLALGLGRRAPSSTATGAPRAEEKTAASSAPTPAHLASPVRGTTLPPSSATEPSSPSAPADAEAATAGIAHATPSLASASAPHPAHPTTAPTVPKGPPTPACGGGEHASKGHCCAVGLEWQTDHCDRPLATEVNF